MSDFYRKHARQIEQLSDLLLTRAEQFMQEQGRPTLPAEAFGRAMQPLEAGDLAGFARTLRDEAVHFVMAGNSDEFWSLQNAVNSLCEALERAGEQLLEQVQRQLVG